MKIINHEKKEMIPLTDKEKETHENQKMCYICEKEFCIDEKDIEFKLNQKVRDNCHYTGKYRGAAHSSELLFAIYVIKYQNRFLLYFIMDLHMSIIL